MWRWWTQTQSRGFDLVFIEMCREEAVVGTGLGRCRANWDWADRRGSFCEKGYDDRLSTSLEIRGRRFLKVNIYNKDEYFNIKLKLHNISGLV